MLSLVVYMETMRTFLRSERAREGRDVVGPNTWRATKHHLRLRKNGLIKVDANGQKKGHVDLYHQHSTLERRI